MKPLEKGFLVVLWVLTCYLFSWLTFMSPPSPYDGALGSAFEMMSGAFMCASFGFGLVLIIIELSKDGGSF